MKVEFVIYLHACTFMQMKEIEPFPQAELFKALADPNRLRILSSLCQCREPQSVSELGDCCDVDLSVLSRHLKQLRHAGIVSAEKQSRHVLYTANAPELAKIFRKLAGALENCACCQGSSNPNQKGTRK